LQPAIVFSSGNEKSTVVKENSEPESSDDMTSDVCKTDKPSNQPFLGSTGLNIVIDNPESVVEAVSSVIGADLILLLNSHIAQKWKFLPKTLKWSRITPEEMRHFLGTNNFDGTSQKGKYKRLLVN